MHKKQEKKKKKREEISKKRVLARRKILRKQASEDKQAGRLNHKFRERMSPIIKDPEKQKIMEQQKNEQILSKLEKNAAILKALEDEYLDEMNQKKEINEKLEAEGHVNLKDKLNALDQKVKETMTEAEKESGQIDLSQSNPKDFSNYC